MIGKKINSNILAKVSLVLILLLSFYLRIHNLGSLDFWGDEGLSVSIARQESFSQFITKMFYTGQQPLYHLILRIWISLFGSSEFVVRLPNIFIGLATIYTLYKFCSTFFDKNTGIICALLTGLSAFHLNFSQEARPYNLMCLLSILSFYYFLQITKEYSKPKMAYYVLSSTLLIYTHTQGIFILLAQNLYFFTLLILRDTTLKIKIKTWFLLMFLIVFLFSPWIYFLTVQLIHCKSSHLGWLEEPSLFQFYITFKNYFCGSETLFAILAISLLISLIKLKDTKLKYSILLWLLIPVIIPYIVSKLLFPIFHYRYELIATVPFYILTSYGINSMNKYFKIPIIIAISFLLFCNINKFYTTHRDYLYRTFQWKESVKYIEQYAYKSDLILVYPYFSLYNNINLYSKRKDLIKIGLNVPFSEKEVKKLRTNKKRIWIFNISRDLNSSSLNKLFSKNYELTIHKVFKGIDITLYNQRNPTQSY